MSLGPEVRVFRLANFWGKVSAVVSRLKSSRLLEPHPFPQFKTLDFSASDDDLMGPHLTGTCGQVEQRTSKPFGLHTFGELRNPDEMHGSTHVVYNGWK